MKIIENPLLEELPELLQRPSMDHAGLYAVVQDVLDAVKKARNTKYILLNAPNEKLADIIALLPGMKSPTVLPLAEPGWSSVHSVLNENDFWEIIEQLKAAGAQGILVVPIEKMVI